HLLIGSTLLLAFAASFVAAEGDGTNRCEAAARLNELRLARHQTASERQTLAGAAFDVDQCRGGRARAKDKGDSDAQVTLDGAGALATVSADAFDAGRTDGFFANLGTNGRSCGTCHVVEDAWTLTPSHARSLAADDPLFTPNDGSDCPPVNAAQGPNSALS